MSKPDYIPDLDQILEYIPKKVNLAYVDYRDEMSPKQMQEVLEEGICTDVYEAYSEQECESIREYTKEGIKEMSQDLIEYFDIDEDDTDEVEFIESWVRELWDEYEDDIRDAFYERNQSDVLSELMGSSNPNMFYSTGIEFGDSSFSDEDEINESLTVIKENLGIKDDAQDEAIKTMLVQASYGGTLEIYFRDFENIVEAIHRHGHNTIHFTGECSVGIIDHRNGSGDTCDLVIDARFPLDKSRIFIEECVSYNWSYDIAGMCGGWCDNTTVSYETGESTDLPESAMSEHVKREAELDKVYRYGGCTAGDMNIKRHRNTTYVNEFPCGNRCEKCGTFWID
jgi:hypothetical protein